MNLLFLLSPLANAVFTAAELATTTHYSDGLVGACGCGDSSGAYSWQFGIGNATYTAAGSQALFDSSGEGWCGSGCGKCYRLTSTGVSACPTCGEGGEAGRSITVMLTNLCPYVTNEEWCPNAGGINAYGYAHHFDIMSPDVIFGDNVVVEFSQVDCPLVARMDWRRCECSSRP
ncbi:hypothetical protein ARAM_000197 [Aspergillus rambellii]|uniref:Expansin-like EG45 domain-containing protein n=1 Tax=Aspergillus rambellii TaxID=308745 RepID=A0A0F8W7W0_9EURO|nr:hypothetical protein ARAM_000197 [Aspergillus rambellii]